MRNQKLRENGANIRKVDSMLLQRTPPPPPSPPFILLLLLILLLLSNFFVPLILASDPPAQGLEGSHASIYLKLCKDKICKEEKKVDEVSQQGEADCQQDRKIKDQDQDQEIDVYRPEPIFAGIVAYLDGRTGRFSALHLTKLLQLHGEIQTGSICHFGGSKLHKAINTGRHANKLQFVRPEWILESISGELANAPVP
eukprot:752865-Hanusia_phi.AAC.1